MLFWIVPRRYGPHLAAASWKRAVLAHVLAIVLVAIVLALSAAIANDVRIDWTAHAIRLQLAQFVVHLAAASTNTGVSWLPTLLAIGCIPLAESALLLLGILLMPWCADGDGARSVFNRSVKNVLWTTTALVPLSIAWWGIAAFGTQYRTSGMSWQIDFSRFLMILVLITAAIWILLRCLLAGASRYAGETDGPAWRPREPHCDQCGYLIVGLPLISACPECGLAVHDSLAGGRRQPTDWQRSELSQRGFLDLVRTQWIVLSDPSFFTRLPVQHGLRTARHFWWGTFLLFAGVALLGVRLILFFFQENGYLGGSIAAAITIMTVPIFAQLMMMFVACVWSQMLLGIRDYRISASTCYYASPLMWPMACVVFAVAGFGWFAAATPARSWLGQEFFVIGFSISFAQAILAMLGLIALLCLVFWWSRLSRALRAVRYANV